VLPYQRVFIVVVDFVIDSVRKLLDTPSYSEYIIKITECYDIMNSGLRITPIAEIIWDW